MFLLHSFSQRSTSIWCDQGLDSDWKPGNKYPNFYLGYRLLQLVSLFHSDISTAIILRCDKQLLSELYHYTLFILVTRVCCITSVSLKELFRN